MHDQSKIAGPGHDPDALAGATAAAARRGAGVPQRALPRLRRVGLGLLAARV